MIAFILYGLLAFVVGFLLLALLASLIPKDGDPIYKLETWGPFAFFLVLFLLLQYG